MNTYVVNRYSFLKKSVPIFWFILTSNIILAETPNPNHTQCNRPYKKERNSEHYSKKVHLNKAALQQEPINNDTQQKAQKQKTLRNTQENLFVTGEFHAQAATAGGAHIYARPEKNLHDAAIFAFNFQKNGLYPAERKSSGAYGAACIRIQGNQQGRIFFDTTKDAEPTSELQERASIDKEAFITRVPLLINNHGCVPVIPMEKAGIPRILYTQIIDWSSTDNNGEPILSNYNGFSKLQKQSSDIAEFTLTFDEPFTTKPFVSITIENNPTTELGPVMAELTSIATTHVQGCFWSIKNNGTSLDRFTKIKPTILIIGI